MTVIFPNKTGFYHPETNRFEIEKNLSVSLRQYETAILLADRDLSGTLVSVRTELTIMFMCLMLWPQSTKTEWLTEEELANKYEWSMVATAPVNSIESRSVGLLACSA